MTSFPAFRGFENAPGVAAALETVETQFIDQGYHHLIELPVIVAGTARDAGNTGFTTNLRAGLTMGGPVDDNATDEFKVKEWDPSDVDGTQIFLGFLKYPLTMTDSSGANQDKYTTLVVAGAVLSDRIIIAGNTAPGMSGTNFELLLQQAQGRIIFDKHINLRTFQTTSLPLFTLSVLGASPNTLTAAQSNRTYTNTGDVAARTVNLPTPYPGLKYTFVRIATQSIILDSGANTFIAPGNIAANTLTLASDGALVEVTGVSATQYLVTRSAGTITPA